jgi:hypothetical protein
MSRLLFFTHLELLKHLRIPSGHCSKGMSHSGPDRLGGQLKSLSSKVMGVCFVQFNVMIYIYCMCVDDVSELEQSP